MNTAAQTINAPFFCGTQFGHNLFHVIRGTDWSDPTLGPRLKKLLDSSTRGGWICTNGLNDVTDYGFVTVPTAACGVITHT